MPLRENDKELSSGGDNRRRSAISSFFFRRKAIEQSQENPPVVPKRPEFKAPTPNGDSFSSAWTQTSEDASREENKVEVPLRSGVGSCSTRSTDVGGNEVAEKRPMQHRTSIDWDERIEAMRQRQRDNSAPNPFAFF
ncbi:hypothetical protein ACHAXS_003584 [Conticribra weissflogii]